MCGHCQSQPWNWRTTLAVLQLNPGKIYIHNICLMNKNYLGAPPFPKQNPCVKKTFPRTLGREALQGKHMDGYREILHHESKHNRTTFRFPTTKPIYKCFATHRHSHNTSQRCSPSKTSSEFFGGHRSQNGALEKTTAASFQPLGKEQRGQNATLDVTKGCRPGTK